MSIQSFEDKAMITIYIQLGIMTLCALCFYAGTIIGRNMWAVEKKEIEKRKQKLVAVIRPEDLKTKAIRVMNTKGVSIRFVGKELILDPSHMV